MAKHIYMAFLVSKYGTDMYVYTPDPVISKVNRVSQLILLGLSSLGQRKFSLII